MFLRGADIENKDSGDKKKPATQKARGAVFKEEGIAYCKGPKAEPHLEIQIEASGGSVVCPR